MSDERPIEGITVLRYADGRVEVRTSAYDACGEYGAPEAWEKKHALLIDACGQVKRDAGVVHSGLEDDDTVFIRVQKPKHDGWALQVANPHATFELVKVGVR